MALYKVNDIVYFNVEALHIRNQRGKIVKINKDIEKGDGYNSYNVEFLDYPRLRRMILRDRHILGVQPFPQEQVPGNLPPAGAVPVLDPNEAIIEFLNKRQEEIKEGAKKKKAAKGIYEQLKEGNEIKIPKPNPDNLAWEYVQQWAVGGNDAPKPIPVDDKPKRNLEDYKRYDVLPEYLIEIGKSVIPVFDIAKVRKQVAVAGVDYRADNFKAERLFIFRTKEGLSFQPKFDPYDEMIYFECPEKNGAKMYNQHQKGGIYNIPEKIRDTNNQEWISAVDYRANVKKGNIPGLKPKKKLRRKYDKMPEIKEEKHYDTKDFVA